MQSSTGEVLTRFNCASELVCWCVLWHETLQPSVQVSPVLALQFPFRKQKSVTCREGWTQLEEQKKKKKKKKTGNTYDWDTVGAQYHSFPWGSLYKYTYHIYYLYFKLACAALYKEGHKCHEETVPGRGLRLIQDHVRTCEPTAGMLGSCGGRLYQSCFHPVYCYLSSTAHAKRLHACIANLFKSLDSFHSWYTTGVGCKLL